MTYVGLVSVMNEMLMFYCHECNVKIVWYNVSMMLGSLAALVYQHSLTPLSLPCKLIIPDSSKFGKIL